MARNVPLQLKKKDVNEFRELYYEEFGELLSYQEAEACALDFLRFMSYVLD